MRSDSHPSAREANRRFREWLASAHRQCLKRLGASDSTESPKDSPLPSKTPTTSDLSSLRALNTAGEVLLRDPIDEALPEFLAIATKVFEAEAGALLLVDRAAREIFFAAASGPAASAVQKQRMVEDAGIAGECLKTGQPVICNDPAAHLSFNGSVDRKSGWKTNNLIAVPLIAEDITFGVLEILNKPGAGFSPADQELAQAFAQLAALAIWNSRRYARCFSAVALDVSQSSSGLPMIGRSKAIAEMKELIPRFARSDSPVLIIGESGVGKEVLARLLWKSSGRSRRVFSAVNCAAIPPTLIESELFGHEKGAFTGAHTRRLGRFEDADKGTLFLDEIGELPLEMQAKMLRVLQEMEVTRIGSTKPVKVDVRIIAATNRDLKEAVAKKLFREDLYFRLNVLNIRVPSLRERQDDIEELARFFIAQFNETMGRAVEGMTPELITRLRNYAWPGNIRELRNTIERLMVLSDGTILSDELLPANIC